MYRSCTLKSYSNSCRIRGNPYYQALCLHPARLKGVSSRRLRQEFRPAPPLLAGHTAMVGVLPRRHGRRPPSSLAQYIERQNRPPDRLTPGHLHHRPEGRRTGGHLGSVHPGFPGPPPGACAAHPALPHRHPICNGLHKGRGPDQREVRASMTSADIVVAGAGHNSLLTACYLAKAGYRCLVLDARSIPGGGAPRSGRAGDRRASPPAMARSPPG